MPDITGIGKLLARLLNLAQPGESKSGRDMRSTLAVTFFALVASTSLASGQTRAQSGSPETPQIYNASFEEVANSCTDMGLRLDKAKISLRRQGDIIQVAIAGVPPMTGNMRKGGSFKAEAKKASAGAKGVEGRFSATGRARARKILLVFVAEFYRAKKPLCTQSWDVTGTRK